ncbi:MULTISPECIES: hypothetical protein [unclassified Corallococcus]|uniref:hypothetical protein n=1 Tax=unclassified Corallococcus TaxID=2685029 RepID=UPI001A8F6651|nr:MULTISPECIES: hypothetical protein [unclassified Corallococcus]MBN9682223.1 hypothetical protein [Corallococcus sp. NCSPR001]WAS86217.1 hypothetical protein O0N60_04415 [Corallococcus sp. NCRR]
MKWYERHVDAGLTRWSLGELSAPESSRLLRHAHACARCGARYDKWARAHRVFESGQTDTPTATELETLTAAGLEAALNAASPPDAAPARWPTLAVLGATLAALFLAVVVTPTSVGPSTETTEPEFSVRGAVHDPAVVPATPVAQPVLRVFCAAPGQSLRELRTGAACTPGATLAFAAGARPPYTHVAVRVRTGGHEEVNGPFPLSGKAGEERPLELTVALPAGADMAEVTATFSEHPAAALAALRQGMTEGVVVLRQEVRVKDSP